MTKRVKLPAELGGAEVDAIDADPLPMTIAGQPVYACQVPGVGWIAVPKSKLTHVPPPPPPEPEPGPWLIGDVVAVRLAHDSSAHRWFVPDLIGADYTVSWATLWREYGREGVAVRRLVPAPEPVTLPWYGKSDLGGELIVAPPVPESRYRLVPMAINGTATTVSPDVARAMAAALLSAADQAEAS